MQRVEAVLGGFSRVSQAVPRVPESLRIASGSLRESPVSPGASLRGVSENLRGYQRGSIGYPRGTNSSQGHFMGSKWVLKSLW